jgi:hypothetical protein
MNIILKIMRSQAVDKLIEWFKPIIESFLAKIYNGNRKLSLPIAMMYLDDHHLVMSIEPSPQLSGGALADREGFAAVLILKRKETVRSDGDVSEFPIAKILRLFK